MAMQAAMNSEPKMYVLTGFCYFENHIIGAVLQKIKIPVCDHLITWLPAWSASRKLEIRIEFPFGFDAFCGICSFALW